jgi:hypothetical protein
VVKLGLVFSKTVNYPSTSSHCNFRGITTSAWETTRPRTPIAPRRCFTSLDQYEYKLETAKNWIINSRPSVGSRRFFLHGRGLVRESDDIRTEWPGFGLLGDAPITGFLFGRKGKLIPAARPGWVFGLLLGPPAPPLLLGITTTFRDGEVACTCKQKGGIVQSMSIMLC